MLLKNLLEQNRIQRIVLASGSPRRKTILSDQGGLVGQLEVIPSTFEENLDKSAFPAVHGYVEATARGKTMQVAQSLLNQPNPPDLVIGADTVVTMGSKIFEKPTDHRDALSMLKRLSGTTHCVITGVVVLLRKHPASITEQVSDVEDAYTIRLFHERSEVMMSNISDETLADYLATNESMDKAGGYGIQALGGQLAEGIKGDYFNVMGFPLPKFCKEMHLAFAERKAATSHTSS